MVWGLNADFVIAAIEDGVGGSVSDGVLVAELVADVLKGNVEVVNVVGKEGAAAGLIGEVFKNLVAIGLWYLRSFILLGSVCESETH